MGEAVVQQLLQKQGLKNVADIFDLTKEDFSAGAFRRQERPII